MDNLNLNPNWTPFFLVFIVLTLASVPVHGQHEELFPHVFNFGSGNDMDIYVQNLSSSDVNNVTATYVGQDGIEAGVKADTLEALGSARFMGLPAGFQGVAKVSCSEDCAVTGTWNFSLEGQGDFAVGISPMDPTKSSTRWAAPIPAVGENSGFGIAVHNVGTSPTTCSLFYYKQGGEELEFRDGFPPNQGISVGGQATFLSANMPGNVPPGDISPDGFEGGLLIRCFEPVIPIVINQNQVNGFPTPIALELRDEPSGE